jgi:hypothetical protein
VLIKGTYSSAPPPKHSPEGTPPKSGEAVHKRRHFVGTSGKKADPVVGSSSASRPSVRTTPRP